MKFECIQFTKPEDGIAVITLDRPDRLNALSGPLLDEVDAAISRAEADEDVRVIVLTGSPRPDGLTGL